MKVKFQIRVGTDKEFHLLYLGTYLPYKDRKVAISVIQKLVCIEENRKEEELLYQASYRLEKEKNCFTRPPRDWSPEGSSLPRPKRCNFAQQESLSSLPEPSQRLPLGGHRKYLLGSKREYPLGGPREYPLISHLRE